MKDQAHKLKLLIDKKRKKRFSNYKKSLSLKQNIIAITSGKGGVGKSSFTTNLSIALAALKQRVLVLDADFGMANLHILFNQKKKNDLNTVFKGICTLEEAIIHTPYKVDLICGASGVSQLVDLSEEEIWLFLDQIQDFNNYDYILIDLSAGISKSVMTFLKTAKFIIVLTTPEPTSLTDAYGVIKAFSLENNYGCDNIFLVLNKIIKEQQVKITMEKMNKTCQQYLNITLNELGFLPKDEYLEGSIYRKLPLIISNPNCQYSKLIRLIVKKMVTEIQMKSLEHPAIEKKKFDFFLKKLLS